MPNPKHKHLFNARPALPAIALLAGLLCGATPVGELTWEGLSAGALHWQASADGRQVTVTPPAGSWARLTPSLGGLIGHGPAAARVTAATVSGGDRPRLHLTFSRPVRLTADGDTLRWVPAAAPAAPQPADLPPSPAATAPAALAPDDQSQDGYQTASPRPEPAKKPSSSPGEPLADEGIADIFGKAGGAALMLGWLIKKFRGESTESNKTLEVIPVTDTKALHVVERGSKILLIEVEGEKSQVISQVSDPNLVNYLKSAKGSLKGSAFLAQYLKRAAVGEPEAATPAAPPAAPPKAEPEAPQRPRFDVTVDDSTPAPAKPVEAPAVDVEVIPAAKPEPATFGIKAEKPAKSEAHAMALQQLEKAMDRFADNTGDGLPSKDVLPSTVKISEPVTHALREVVSRQVERIEAIKETKRREDEEKIRVEGLLARKVEVEDKIGQIQEMLSRIDVDASRNQPTVETSLLATSRELQQLEEELSKIMTDPGVIKYLLQERDDVPMDGRNPLDSIVNSVKTIERQRKQIAAIRHTREQAEAERRRVVVLLIRKNELETAIDEIKQVLKQIEETNAEIMHLDPYAMPETVPIVAMNELRRLEFELNTILADPGVAKKLAEAPQDAAQLGGKASPSEAQPAQFPTYEPTI